MIMRCLMVSSLTVVAALHAVHAQAPVRRLTVTDQPACPRCTIELRKVVTLGANGDSVSPDIMATVARDSKGNFYVGPVDTPGAVLIYDSSGRIVGSVGRRGQGPGEHLEIGFVKVGPGDTLHVFDAGTFRLSVYSPARKLVRTVPLPARALILDVLPQPSGDVVINAEVSTPSAIGFPLHRINSKGEIVRSFGALAPVVVPGEQRARRASGPGGVNSFWHGEANRYDIERWTIDGKPDVILSRTAAWFAPYAPREGSYNPQVVKPRPRLRRITQTQDTVVWVGVDVADASWKQVSNASPDSEMRMGVIDDYLALYDTVLEAINPATGRLLASTRVDAPLHRFFGDGFTFSHRADSAGYRFLDVWQFRLVAPTGAAR